MESRSGSRSKRLLTLDMSAARRRSQFAWWSRMILEVWLPFFATTGTAFRADAILIQVDWTAEVTQLTAGQDPGAGTLSGTLGQFDVTFAGQEFVLPADGSLSVTSTGFNPLFFPNIEKPFTGGANRVAFRFDSLSPVSGQLVPVGNPPAPFLFVVPFFEEDGCVPQGRCQINLNASNTADALIGNVSVPGFNISRGSVAFSFTVIPEPGTMALVGVGFVLLGAGVSLGRRRRVTGANRTESPFGRSQRRPGRRRS